MDLYTQLLAFALIGFFTLIFIEWLASIILKKPVHRFMDSISSLTSGITNTIYNILKIGVVIVSYNWSYQYLALFELPSHVGVYLVALIGIDFASYWGHRWNHRYNLLWNRHIVHHSSEEFNLPCALRQSISAIFQIYFFLYLPLAIIGVKPEIIAVLAPLHLFAQFWYHTRLIDKMGWLEQILVTPSHHRVHHAINAEYIDKNFSAIFIVWDKWFGTFQPELDHVTPVYGVKRPVSTWNPILINYKHLWQLLVDAWHTKRWRDKLSIWFMPVGWRPADVANDYPLVDYNDASTQVKYDTQANMGLKLWSLLQFMVLTTMLGHLAVAVASLTELQAIAYGAVIMLTVYANSALMDRSRFSLLPEALKTIGGLVVVFQLDGWFAWQTGYSSAIIICYLMLSLAMAWAFLPRVPRVERSSESIDFNLANG